MAKTRNEREDDKRQERLQHMREQIASGDLVVLCANCHRIAHRMSPLPTLDDLRATLR